VPDVNDIRGFTRLLIVNADTYEKDFDQILNVRNPFVSLDDILELSFRVKYHDLGKDPLNTLIKSAHLAVYGLQQYANTEDTSIELTTERWDLLSSLTDDLHENGIWEVGYALCKAILHLFPEDDEFMFKVEMFKDSLERTANKQAITETDEETPVSIMTPRSWVPFPPGENFSCKQQFVYPDD
ncbi:hypothetical protein WDU94_004647, partial [Cyamophila willieti]